MPEKTLQKQAKTNFMAKIWAHPITEKLQSGESVTIKLWRHSDRPRFISRPRVLDDMREFWGIL